MQPSQIPLSFNIRPASEREDFLVAPPNEDAVNWIDRWPDWPGQFLLIVGPAGSGKSHLAEVWKSRSNAELIEANSLEGLTIEQLDKLASTPLICENAGVGLEEEAFLHLYNLVMEKKGSLLITARTSPKNWNIALPDLKSRLGTIPVATVSQPDDQLFAALIVKHFSDRQLAVEPDVVQYLLQRLERSFSEARRIVAVLDEQALAQKRNITIPLVRDIMNKKQEL